MCGLCFSRPSAHQTEEGLFICGNCHREIEEIKKESPNVVDRKRKDPSELCCQCGLCCVLLSARVEEDEAKTIFSQARNKSLGPEHYEDVFTIEEKGPNEGHTVIRFPCSYLRGKTLEYVNCAVYGLDRPSVCRSYLCKVAIRFGLGLITIKEAQFVLRSSFVTGGIDLFNWTHSRSDSDQATIDQDIQDQKLLFYDQINEQAQRMIKNGTPRDLVGMVVSSQITPVYEIKNDACHVLLNMHLAALDRGYVDPKVYVEEEEINSWSIDQKLFATRVIEDVLGEIRDLFATRSELEQIGMEMEKKKEDLAEIASLEEDPPELQPPDVIIDSESGEEKPGDYVRSKLREPAFFQQDPEAREKVLKDLADMLSEECQCPGECPLHDPAEEEKAAHEQLQAVASVTKVEDVEVTEMDATQFLVDQGYAFPESPIPDAINPELLPVRKLKKVEGDEEG